MDYSLKPPQLDVYDHGNALFSTEGDGRIRQLSEVQDELLVGEDHCLLEILPTDEYFGKWITRIRAVPDY